MITWIRCLIAAGVAEIRLMVREPSLVMVLLVIPVAYPLILGFLYEQDLAVERPTVIVDHDNSSLSRGLIRDLDATQEIRVVSRLEALEQGWDAIRAQQVDLLVYIPSDFSSGVKRGEQTHIKLWVNSGNMLTYGIGYAAANAVIVHTNDTIGQRFFLGKGMGSAAAQRRTSPVARVDRLLFHPTGGYGSFFVPGVLLIVIQQVVLIGMAFSAGLQRELNPSAEPPRYPYASLAGKAIAQVLFYLLGAAFIVFGVMPRFGWGGPNHLVVFGLFSVFAIAVTPIAIAIASLVSDRYAAFQVLMLASAPVFLVSGFSWPLEQMPAAARAFASILPSTPALLALRTLSMKTSDLSVVLPQIHWLLALFGLWLVVSLVIVRRSWRRFYRRGHRIGSTARIR